MRPTPALAKQESIRRNQAIVSSRPRPPRSVADVDDERPHRGIAAVRPEFRHRWLRSFWRRWCPRITTVAPARCNPRAMPSPDPAVAAGDQCHVAGQVVPGCLRRHGAPRVPTDHVLAVSQAHDRPADEHRQPVSTRAAPTGRRWPRAHRTPPGRRSVRPPPRRHRRGGRRRRPGFHRPWSPR